MKPLMTPKECASRFYDRVRIYAADKLDQMFAVEEQAVRLKDKAATTVRLPFQNLCKEIAQGLKIKDYAAYYCTREYIEKERPDLRIKPGRYGGVEKVQG